MTTVYASVPIGQPAPAVRRSLCAMCRDPGSAALSLRLAIGVLLLTLLPVPSAQAVEIDRTLWGFQSEVVPGRFNLLSALVRNPRNEPFRGTFFLQKGRPGRLVGERIVAGEVYIAPNASRWIQFYPFIEGDKDEWYLTWRSEAERDGLTIDPAENGRPARVQLISPDIITRPVRGVAGFYENLFPGLVTATDGLHTVVLAHVPRWDESRQQSFLDWVGRGGTVHLLREPNGKFPQFSGPLSVLNGDAQKQRVGAGVIFRHPHTPGDVPEELVKSEILAPLVEVGQGGPIGQSSGSRWNNLEEGLLGHLRDMTNPDHNWVLIYFLSLLYLGVFPGVYLLGRQRRHFGLIYGALLGAVALFSLAFHTVGARGYGESTAIHTVAIARSVEPGMYDVSQWSYLFVVRGDDYTLQHDGSGVLYSTANANDSLKGGVTNPPGAIFTVDVPPFSGRGFLNRMKIAGPKFTARVLNMHTDPTDQLSSLTLKLEGDIPIVIEAPSIVFGRSLFRLAATAEPGKYVLADNGLALESALAGNEFNNFRGGMSAFYDRQPEKPTPEQLFQNILPVLKARCLDVDSPQQLNVFSLPTDRLRLLLVSKLPETHFAHSPAIGPKAQRGYVVYCVDVPVEKGDGGWGMGSPVLRRVTKELNVCEVASTDISAQRAAYPPTPIPHPLTHARDDR